MPLSKILEYIRDNGDDPEQKTLEAISIYEKEQSFRKLGDDVYKKSKELEWVLEEKLKGVKPELMQLSMRIHKCANHGFYLLRVAELKVLYLLRALKHDLEDRNPLTLASNTRGLIEHTAAMAYAGNALERLLVGLKGQGSESRIIEVVSKAEAIIERCFYGSSPKEKKSDKPRAVHINECLKVLENQPGLNEINKIYGYLCEFVHPNFGSNTLVSTGIIGEGTLDPPQEYHKEAIQIFCTGCLLCLSHQQKFLVPSYSLACIRLEDLVYRCLSKGAKLTNVFSVREPSEKSVGDSRENAIFFPKARTHFEAMEMAYTYMQTRNLVLQNVKKHIGGFEGQFLYEYWDTPEGKIWFKYDFKKSGLSNEDKVPKVSRNDPCTCGSGKKFKNCCES